MGVCGKWINYYENLGYTIPRWINPINNKQYVKKGTKIWVSSLDVPEKSDVLLEFICDYCGEIYEANRKNQPNSNHCCNHCKSIKFKNTSIQKFGVDNPAKSKEIQTKISNTIYNKYGVYNLMQNDAIKEKAFKTNLQKYGVKNPNQNKEVLEKRRKTCIEKYGVNSSFQNDIVKNKIKKSIQEKYGVDYISQSSEIKEKVKQTTRERYGVDSVLQLEDIRKRINPNTSRQQKYICELLHGELNVPCGKYYLDIVIDKNIDLEIDFGGHDLQVKYGNITKEEFHQKEIIRDNVVRRKGYKVIRIISRKDYLPSDEKIIEMINFIRRYFEKYSYHSWMTFDIDNNILKCAEFKDGVYYDFGKLHKLKRCS